jgi:hypothetical protein
MVSDCGWKFHSLAIKTDGTMWSWGNDGSGQTGHNNVIDRSSPVQIGALTTWSQIAAGGNFSLAIKTDGTMWSWGAASTANSALTHNKLPLQPSTNRRINYVVSNCGWKYFHSLALKLTARCGAGARVGASGRLGLNDTSLSLQPSTSRRTHYVVSNCGWKYYFSLAIKTDGTMWSWGVGSSGKLGHNDTINRSSPVQIGALTTWSQIAAGSAHSLAIKTDGTLWSWGSGVRPTRP